MSWVYFCSLTRNWTHDKPIDMFFFLSLSLSLPLSFSLSLFLPLPLSRLRSKEEVIESWRSVVCHLQSVSHFFLWWLNCSVAWLTQLNRLLSYYSLFPTCNNNRLERQFRQKQYFVLSRGFCDETKNTVCKIKFYLGSHTNTSFLIN